MPVDSRHPDYTQDRADEWALCRDAYDGESAIKARGIIHLPKPSGFTAMDDNGQAMYAAYMMRAQFPDIFAPTVGAMVGIIHEGEIDIELPAGLEYLREDADGGDMTLTDMHRRITRNLLITGRQGLLADAPVGGGEPHLALYSGRSVINWDRDFYVLDETHKERDGFEWVEVRQHRVIEMRNGRCVQRIWRDGEPGEEYEVRIAGGGYLNRLPFSIASAKDVGPRIETPPLIGVARAAVAIYQLSADYRHQLFMSGQETLVAINGEPPSAVGAGVVHQMMGDGDLQPDLKYVSPSCSGIEAHLKAIEHNREAAVQSGARLFEQGQQAQESGEARKMRFRSETANLQSIAQMSCAIMEFGLRCIAAMKGADEDAVTVTPPRDLLDASLTPQDALALWQIVQQRGLSWETYYQAIQKGGLADPDRDADDEYRLIDQIDGMDGEVV